MQHFFIYVRSVSKKERDFLPQVAVRVTCGLFYCHFPVTKLKSTVEAAASGGRVLLVDERLQVASMTTKGEQKHLFSPEESGRRVRRMRNLRGMMIEELAERVGISDAMIKSIEYGEKGGSMNTYIKLCGALNTSLSYIAEGDRYVDILLQSGRADHTGSGSAALRDSGPDFPGDKDEQAYKSDVARMIDIMGHLNAEQRACLVKIAESYDEGVKAGRSGNDD